MDPGDDLSFADGEENQIPLAESTAIHNAPGEEDDGTLNETLEQEPEDSTIVEEAIEGHDDNSPQDYKERSVNDQDEDDDEEDDEDEEEDDDDNDDSQDDSQQMSNDEDDEEDNEEDAEDNVSSSVVPDDDDSVAQDSFVETYPPLEEESEKKRRKTTAGPTSFSSVTTTKSTSSADSPAPPVKRGPGRPSKAEMLRREKERQERIERGEVVDEPKRPRRRGRKPMDPEKKAQLREERMKLKKAERAAKMRERRKRLKMEKEESGEIVPKKRGRKARILTEEEKAAREEQRKQKYEEFKRAKAEKAAKRAERNLALREYRKKRKEEEQKRREAHEKRMQELKASFLDENSHLSVGDITMDGGLLDESSQGSWTQKSRLSNFEMTHLNPIQKVTAETLFEYRWPLEGKTSEHYFLQEQVCEYLGLKSFKRRYPNIARRNVDREERDFLVEMRVVNETQADLGLTALLSSTVLDIMSADFYDKYDAYMQVVADRKDKVMRQTNYTTATVEKHKYADFVEKSVRSAASWNKQMNQDRKEKRQAYFDMQTFTLHRPVMEKGKMKVLRKPKLGNYPVALIPGQFVDYYKMYTPKQLAYLPLNSTLKGPPKAGIKLSDFGETSNGEEESNSESSESGSESSDDSSSSDSDSSSDEEVEEEKSKEIKKEPEKPRRPIDAEIKGAKCKTCLGDSSRNKLGQPEKLLHCSKCDNSMHPSCIGLLMELLEHVTSYNWECTDCKVCSKCHDHADEDKMLFCDLCDRGYHNYCVGLDTIPSGNWHCFECTYCISCKTRDDPDSEEQQKWIVEYKTGNSGNKIYSHTMCAPCHRAWKRGQFCPECLVVFGKEDYPIDEDVDYVLCWVCARQHHTKCVGQPTFICSSCQRRTLEKTVGPAQRKAYMRATEENVESPRMSKASSSQSAPPVKVRASMESGPVQCDICLKIYKNRSTLYSHKNRDHGVKASTVLN